MICRFDGHKNGARPGQKLTLESLKCDRKSSKEVLAALVGKSSPRLSVLVLNMSGIKFSGNGMSSEELESDFPSSMMVSSCKWKQPAHISKVM